MAGTVTTLATPGSSVGLVASGTATGLQGTAATPNVRAAFSGNIRFPNSGSRGLLGVGLVAVTTVTQTAPAGDLCWPAIEVGFLASDGTTVRYAVAAATRGIDGVSNADLAFVTQHVWATAGIASSQLTPDFIIGATQTPAPTFTAATGVDNGIIAPLIFDYVRVGFWATHAGATGGGGWNLQWRLYAYQA